MDRQVKIRINDFFASMVFKVSRNLVKNYGIAVELIELVELTNLIGSLLN